MKEFGDWFNDFNTSEVEINEKEQDMIELGAYAILATSGDEAVISTTFEDTSLSFRVPTEQDITQHYIDRVNELLESGKAWVAFDFNGCCKIGLVGNNDETLHNNN